MKKRIVGIDVARALAIFGMIIVNFKIVFGSEGEGRFKSFAQFFEGKAAATFVVLAGVGIALMAKSALKNKDVEKLKRIRLRIIKRAIFLFIVGLSYIAIWPADILHFYGIYMLITLFFITRKSKTILIGTGAMILLFPLLLILFNYETGWNFNTFEYLDFWSIKGFFRNLFFNGFHPVIPWTAFMLCGLWFGRQDLNNNKYVEHMFMTSLGFFVLFQILSSASLGFIAKGDMQVYEEFLPILGTSPMPPMPIYIISGIAISITIISGCILLARKFENSFIIKVLNQTGQLALTFYVAHVILGMGLVEEFGPKKLGEYSIDFSVIYALTFSLSCIVFAVIWLKYKKSGPLEWVIRKLTD